jgi:hypothetical protein
VSEEELKQILAAHETWLETGGEEGKQADLCPNRFSLDVSCKKKPRRKCQLLWCGMIV